MIIATIVLFLHRTDMWLPWLPLLLGGSAGQFLLHLYIKKRKKPIAFLLIPYVVTYLTQVWALISVGIYMRSGNSLDLFPICFGNSIHAGNGFSGMCVLGMLLLFLGAGSIAWGIFCFVKWVVRLVRSH
jgi:hypothetical protein